MSERMWTIKQGWAKRKEQKIQQFVVSMAIAIEMAVAQKFIRFIRNILYEK